MLLLLIVSVFAVGALGNHDQQDSMAYHILYCNHEMQFLGSIMAEVLKYPVTTHVYIHTHSAFQMPKHGLLPNITVVKHEVDLEASRHLHSMEHKSRLEARGDMLAMTPSVREHIINVGRVHAFSMYSEDDLLVRAETVQLWMVSHEELFARNFSLGFIRVECKTVCNSVDILFTPKVPLDIGDKRFSRINPTDRKHCGTWLYPAKELARLDQQYPSFLRYNRESGKWNVRESLAIGGAEVYDNVVFASQKTKSSLLQENIILHHGTRLWHYGVWWCKIFPIGSDCPDPPELFFLLSSQVAGRSRREREARSPMPSPPEVAHTAQVMNALQPLALHTCSLAAVAVNRSKLHHMSSPAMFVSPHPLHVAYGPWLTKCGSSSAVKLVEEVTNTSLLVAKTAGKETMSPDMYHNNTFISFVRHPLDRALAGYHQLEVFYQFGWFDIPIDQYGLRWWDNNCLNSTYGNPLLPRKKTCSGSVPNNSQETVLRRLVGYLEEIERVGFIDQHLTPMSWLMATNPVSASPRAFVFDMKQMGNVSDVLTNFTGFKWGRLQRMSRPSQKQENMPWAVSWKELVIESATSPMALRAVELLCHLYRDDIMCLPYDIPECEGFGL